MRYLFYIFLFVFTGSGHAQHQIEYRISALGNLIYQLDCLGQVARFSCSRSSFQQLWQQQNMNQAMDHEMLVLWTEIRSKLDNTLELSPELKSDRLPTTNNYPSQTAEPINLLEKVRLLAFVDDNQQAYLKTIGALISEQHAHQERAVIAHFYPRFESWFKTRRPQLEQFIKEAQIIDDKAQTNQLLTAMRTFFRSQIPQVMILPVHLVAHPAEQANSSGLAFAEHSIIEVLDNEHPRTRLGVVIHEIAHFYHERALEALHQEMMSFFVTEPSKTGKAGYYLFNEAMATALGNGLFEAAHMTPEDFTKYQEYPMSFYADQGIDQAAKAALPLVKQTIQAAGTIDAAFLQQLDAIWSQTLQEIKTSPQQHFRHVGMVINHSQDSEVIDTLFELIKPSSASVNTLPMKSTNPSILNIEKHSHLDAIIVVEQAAQLKNIPGLAWSENQTIPDDSSASLFTILTKANGTKQVVVISSSLAEIRGYFETLLSRPAWPTSTTL